MTSGIILAIGVVGGIWLYLRSERARRRAVAESVRERGGLTRQEFVKHFSGVVVDQVSAAVFKYFSHGAAITSSIRRATFSLPTASMGTFLRSAG